MPGGMKALRSSLAAVPLASRLPKSSRTQTGCRIVRGPHMAWLSQSHWWSQIHPRERNSITYVFENCLVMLRVQLPS